MTSSALICLMAKASATQAWLWHRRLSHLNCDYINLLSKKDVVIGLPKLKYVKDQLCSSYEVSKAKRSSFKTKAVPSSKGRLNLLHIDLCGPMRVASINGKKYILAEAIATACYTQNRSIIISTHEKTAYHIINDKRASIKHLYIFGCTCYLTRDGENLDNMKEKRIRAFWPRSPMTKGTSSVNKSSSPTDNSKQQDTPPTTNIQSSTEPTTPTNVNAEENNDNQAEELHQFDRLQVLELIDKPFGKTVIKLKWLWKNTKIEDQNCRIVIRHDLLLMGYVRKSVMIVIMAFLKNGSTEGGGGVYVALSDGLVDL
ncbi:retrovirus-related pol polyprotein from transposon TNT 1-94 [Tanacetum coccineum]